MNQLSELKSAWHDTPEFHKHIHESFIEKVNSIPELKRHRDWVEKNIWGFGERSFLWMWWLLVQEMPEESVFVFGEIGVFRAAILSVIRVIADMQGKDVQRYGITPMSTASDKGENKNWESDYKRDIEVMHETFGTPKDYTILHGLSTDPKIIQEAQTLSFDLFYVDGAHDYESVESDLKNYAHLVRKGGFLICDDSCSDFHMPFGYFQGIDTCTNAVVDFFKDNKDFEFVGNVVHCRIYRKK